MSLFVRCIGEAFERLMGVGCHRPPASWVRRWKPAMTISCPRRIVSKKRSSHTRSGSRLTTMGGMLDTRREVASTIATNNATTSRILRSRLMSDLA